MGDLRPPRFPYVGALLCAACVGAAVWTWMMYSYCREMRTDEWPGRDHPRVLIPKMIEEAGSSSMEALTGRYVQVRGSVRRCRPVTVTCLYVDDDRISTEHMGWQLTLVHEGRAIQVCYPRTHDAPTKEGAEVVIRGRVEGNPWDSMIGTELGVNATASRFHGGTITGLVVGAMGVFVFTVALRHWLGERRKFREEARGHNTGMKAVALRRLP